LNLSPKLKITDDRKQPSPTVHKAIPTTRRIPATPLTNDAFAKNATGGMQNDTDAHYRNAHVKLVGECSNLAIAEREFAAAPASGHYDG